MGVCQQVSRDTLSGVAMISENTADASFSRFTELLSLASRGTIARMAARIIRILTSSVHPVNLTRILGVTFPYCTSRANFVFC